MYVFHQNLTQEPALNLAIEETLLHAVDEDLFMLWRDAPSVIIGRGQDALAEVDIPYAREQGIAIVRRMSGGGAVYHDRGNLCFTFISLRPGEAMGDQAPYIARIVAALNRLGVPASAQGRNDISVEGLKVSGNAQYAWEGRLLHHGTLLFDADMTALDRVLRPDPAKLRGKGIASVRARVGNLAAHLPGMDVDSLAQALLEDWLARDQHARLYTMPPALLREAQELARCKYRDEGWVFGRSQKYDIIKRGRFGAGSVEIRLKLDHGLIQEAALHGDFLALHDAEPLARAMRGMPVREDALRAALAPVYHGQALGGITLEELLSLFSGEGG